METVAGLCLALYFWGKIAVSSALSLPFVVSTQRPLRSMESC